MSKCRGPLGVYYRRWAVEVRAVLFPLMGLCALSIQNSADCLNSKGLSVLLAKYHHHCTLDKSQGGTRRDKHSHLSLKLPIKLKFCGFWFSCDTRSFSVTHVWCPTLTFKLLRATNQNPSNHLWPSTGLLVTRDENDHWWRLWFQSKFNILLKWKCKEHVLPGGNVQNFIIRNGAAPPEDRTTVAL